jgi:hypothetical protein
VEELRNAGVRNIAVFEATGHIGDNWVYSENVKCARSSTFQVAALQPLKQRICDVVLHYVKTQTRSRVTKMSPNTCR